MFLPKNKLEKISENWKRRWSIDLPSRPKTASVFEVQTNRKHSESNNHLNHLRDVWKS